MWRGNVALLFALAIAVSGFAGSIPAGGLSGVADGELAVQGPPKSLQIAGPQPVNGVPDSSQADSPRVDQLQETSPPILWKRQTDAASQDEGHLIVDGGQLIIHADGKVTYLNITTGETRDEVEVANCLESDIDCEWTMSSFPSDGPSEHYVTSNDGTLYKITDGGVTWQIAPGNADGFLGLDFGDSGIIPVHSSESLFGVNETTGRILWRYSLEEKRGRFELAVTDSGDYDTDKYILTPDGIASFNISTGTKGWEHSASFTSIWDQTAFHEEEAFVATNGEVRKLGLDDRGTVEWHQQIGISPDFTEVRYFDTWDLDWDYDDTGVLIATYRNGNGHTSVRLANETGAVMWQSEGQPLREGRQGTLFLATESKLTNVNATHGGMNWEIPIENSAYRPKYGVDIERTEVGFLVRDSQQVRRLDPATGETRWEFTPAHGGPDSLHVPSDSDSSSRIAVTTDQGAIYCLDPATGRVEWSVDLSDDRLAETTLKDGKLIALTSDGMLYALDLSTEPQTTKTLTAEPTTTTTTTVSKTSTISTVSGTTTTETTTTPPQSTTPVPTTTTPVQTTATTETPTQSTPTITTTTKSADEHTDGKSPDGAASLRILNVTTVDGRYPVAEVASGQPVQVTVEYDYSNEGSHKIKLIDDDPDALIGPLTGIELGEVLGSKTVRKKSGHIEFVVPYRALRGAQDSGPGQPVLGWMNPALELQARDVDSGVKSDTWDLSVPESSTASIYWKRVPSEAETGESVTVAVYGWAGEDEFLSEDEVTITLKEADLLSSTVIGEKTVGQHGNRFETSFTVTPSNFGSMFGDPPIELKATVSGGGSAMTEEATVHVRD